MDRELNKILNSGKEIAEMNEVLKEELNKINSKQQFIIKNLYWKVKESHKIILAALAIAHRKNDKELIYFLESACVTIAGQDFWESGKCVLNNEEFEELIEEGKIHQKEVLLAEEKGIQEERERSYAIDAELSEKQWYYSPELEDDDWDNDPCNPESWNRHDD